MIESKQRCVGGVDEINCPGLKQHLSHSVLAVCVLSAIACAAKASSTTSQPQADAITYSSARISWVANANSTSIIRWGTTGPPYSNTTTTSKSKSSRANSWFLSGLRPSTTYHFSVCSNDGGGSETCSADQTLLTLERGNPTPIAPAKVDMEMPPANGSKLTVGANCDDPSSGLAARWQQANWGDTVVIPVTTVCTGTYIFPAKTGDTQIPHRWIVTQSSAADQLPPPGVRVDPVVDGAKFARIESNRPTLLMSNTSALPAACEAGGYAWVSDDPRAFKLQQCRPDSPRSITGGTGDGVSPIVITVPNHGILGNPYVRVDSLIGTNTNAKGTFRATVLDSNHIQLNYGGYTAWKGNGDIAGGLLVRNTWQPVAFGSGASLPETCAEGDWFLKRGLDPKTNTFRCLALNTWTRFSLQGSSGTNDSSAIILSTNSARYLRFTGLEITSIRLPPEPLFLQLSTYPYGHPGSVFYSLVDQNSSNSHIVWDRCYIHGQSDRERNHFGVVLDGDNVAIVDSHVSDFFLWTGSEPGGLLIDEEASAIFMPTGPGPFLIANNFIEAGGISVYVPSDWCCGLGQPPSDGTVSGNTFYLGEEWRAGSPTFAGKQVLTRHLFELKAGKRWLIEGNTFDGTMSSINQAAAIALTPRAGSSNSFFPLSSISSGVVRLTGAFGHCLEGVQVGDWVDISGSSNLEHNTAWRVTSASANGCKVWLTGISGSSTGGFAQLMTSRIGVSDINVKNNIFQNVVNGIFIIGHTDERIQLETTNRIRIHNNLFLSLDGSRGNSYDTSGYPNGQPFWGYPIYASLGMEDLTVTHNTVVSTNGGTSFQLEKQNDCTAGNSCNPHAGLLYENNIVFNSSAYGALNASNSIFGKAALDLLWRNGDQPDWSYRNNILVGRGPLPAQPPLGPYPSLNRLHDLNSTDMPFLNRENNDFRLRSAYRSVDTCYETPGDCSSDGADVGVNMDELLHAQGPTNQIRLKRARRR